MAPGNLAILVYFVGVAVLGIRAQIAWVRFSRLYHLANLPADASPAERSRYSSLYPYVFGPMSMPAAAPDAPELASARQVWLSSFLLGIAFAILGFIGVIFMTVLSASK